MIITDLKTIKEILATDNGYIYLKAKNDSITKQRISQIDTTKKVITARLDNITYKYKYNQKNVRDILKPLYYTECICTLSKPNTKQVKDIKEVKKLLEEATKPFRIEIETTSKVVERLRRYAISVNRTENDNVMEQLRKLRNETTGNENAVSKQDLRYKVVSVRQNGLIKFITLEFKKKPNQNQIFALGLLVGGVQGSCK